jgi:hypothetical protein
MAALAAQDDALRPALAHDPGEAYFETFADRVEDRLRAAGLRGAQAKSWEGRGLGWLRSPGRLAAVGAVVAVIGGAAIVVVTARLERPAPAVTTLTPALERSLARPSEPAPPATSAPGTRASRPEDEAATGNLAAGPEPAERRERVLAKSEERADVAVPGQAPLRETEAAPAPAAGMAQSAPPPVQDQGTAPRRLVTSRRTASGEDVPVNPGAYSFAAPPPGAARDQESKSGMPEQPKGGLPRRAVPAGEQKLGAQAMSEARAPGATEARICGRVTDSNGRPVAGAQVAIADLGLGDSTDADGRFCLAAPAGPHSLAVMAVGYHESRLQVGATREAAETRVTLRPVPVLDRGLEAFTRTGDRNSALAGREAGARDPFAVLPESLRTRAEEARRLADRARASGAAEDFDAAAAGWERVVPRVSGDAVQEARYRRAEARFLAWQAGAGESRARAASDALVAYLRYARAGAHRDQAAAWLAQVLR